MKNKIYAAIAMAITPMLAHAAPNCCGTAPCALVGTDITYDSSCTTTSSCTCNSTTVSNSYGIDVTTGKTHNVYCIGNTVYSKCEVSLTATYACASGYYGTATSETAGCTKCPTNATCAGGNGSTFKCNQGYYKNGTACTRCPSSGGVYGTTAAAGATDITSCYIPSGSSFSDTYGSGTYTGNCYYAK